MTRAVLVHPDLPPEAERFGAAPRVGFDVPANLRGSTTHFNVYYDSSLDGTGATISDGILATCEGDYNAISAYFGGITPSGLPYNMIILAGYGGAYHYGCGGVDLYCHVKTSPSLDIDFTRMLLVAEMDEVFMAAQGAGWDCSTNNGEGLSRVLATALYPTEFILSVPSWLDTPDRPDFVNNTDPTDGNYVSIGCAVLFLNYLHSQLDFTWKEIVQAAASTLQQTYTNLTGSTDGWSQFTSLLQTYYPVGTPSGLTTDNPFPLRGSVTFPFCGVQFRGTVPANSTQRWFTFNWPFLWHVVWTVVPTTVSGGSPQINWRVQIERSSGQYLTYWIDITNSTGSDVDIEARYCVLGA